MNKHRYVAVSVDWCYLCGLQIPDIVNPHHKLFGTVDHVKPVTKNGSRKAVFNRRATHRICNMTKGSERIERVDRNALRKVVIGLLEAARITVSPKQLSRAVLRSDQVVQDYMERFRLVPSGAD